MSKNIYVVYKTHYKGTLLPPFYIGSSYLKKIQSGYCGSVASKAYRDTFNKELRENPHLFEVEILSYHSDRRECLEEEYNQQIKNNVVKSELFMNKATSRVNGFFGMDVSGKNNPMYGRSRTGEKHKGGENISKGVKKFYTTEAGKARLKIMSEINTGEKNPASKVTDNQVLEIRRMWSTGDYISQKELWKQMNLKIGYQAFNNIIKGYTYKHLL